MTHDMVIVPSHEADYVELARTKTGKLFRKHILSKGTMRHPKTGAQIKIDDDFITKLTTNFNNRVCDIVQVPLAGPNNEHVENPDANLGEVVDVQVEGDKVFAVLDIRDADAQQKMGKTYLGASAMLSLDYEDTRTGQKVGPTLLHSCVTNRPYIVDLDPYEEIVAASAEGTSDIIVLSMDDEQHPDDAPASSSVNQKEDEIMDLDTLLTELKTEHGIDVRELQDQNDSLTDQLADANKTLEDTLAATNQALGSVGLLKLTNGEEVTSDTLIGAIQELGETNVSFSNRLSALEADKNVAEIDALVAKGFIKPADKEAMLELRLTNLELFNKLLPSEPIVKFSSEEAGFTPVHDEGHSEDVDAHIARYSEMAAR